jgi:hypothetical protein
MFRNSVSTSQKTHYVFITKTNWLLQFREIIGAHVLSEVLTTVIMNSITFWDVTPCSLVEQIMYISLIFTKLARLFGAYLPNSCPHWSENLHYEMYIYYVHDLTYLFKNSFACCLLLAWSTIIPDDGVSTSGRKLDNLLSDYTALSQKIVLFIIAV